MKLYFAPGACSLAPHIVINEARLPCQYEKVDLGNHQTEHGADYTKINPKGYVPALLLDSGELLTEVGVIVQYLADQKPTSHLVAAAGTLARYRQMEWLSFISTEIHKQLGPFFRPTTPAETKEQQLQLLGRRFDYLVEQLKGGAFLTGETFTVADAYLFTVLSWTTFLKLDTSRWPALGAYLGRVRARPAVTQTLKDEGLLK
ncbi:MAG: glutathione transferase GstA [Acidiferrobacter sp.]